MKTREIRTERLLLRPFRESDYDDLFEFLSQLEDDEFEGYPGITYKNGREYMKQRLGSEEFYAAEALSAVIAQAFPEGAHRIYAECDPRNEASRRLLEKAGLRREAHFRQNISFRRDEQEHPVWKDTFVYAILNTEHMRQSENGPVL